jgi:flagellar biosynthesis component FlhA
VTQVREDIRQYGQNIPGVNLTPSMLVVLLIGVVFFVIFTFILHMPYFISLMLFIVVLMITFFLQIPGNARMVYFMLLHLFKVYRIYYYIDSNVLLNNIEKFGG